ncbi:conserved Plasmodium protein, unknown function [Plasmodium ovale curtisi]|uniref:CLAMP domain-containing protein n=1 Tax=Plasmodium ovale curtisi TaxID=864141 RepID=A0A1A8WKK0_PLAOA|nr:conserved Plasmodium protein, unknown function [Plasmodium ovale curtisi]
MVLLSVTLWKHFDAASKPRNVTTEKIKMEWQNEDIRGKTKIFKCADIKKKEMRKIIIMSNRKRQKRTLLEKLNIRLNIENDYNRITFDKVVLDVDNFLPNGVNNEKNILEIYNFGKKKKTKPKELSICSINNMRKKKIKKIVGDLFHNILLFCIRKNLSIVEISTFISIQKYVFLKFIYNCDNIKNIFLELKNILLRHSINRAPYHVKIFSYTSAKMLLNYSLKMFFKNFSFYKFIFNPTFSIHFGCELDHVLGFEMDAAKETTTRAEATTDDGVVADGMSSTPGPCFLDDDSVYCSLSTNDGAKLVKDLLKLNTGSINTVCPSANGESGEDVFMKEIQQYFDTFFIKNDPIVFEINKCKRDRNLQRVFTKIKNNTTPRISLMGNDINGKEQSSEKFFSKEQLTKRVDSLYSDLEGRVISRLNMLLNGNNS